MNFDLGFYWALFLRRFPVMTMFVLLFSGLGLVTAFKLPETYSTSARLLFEAPQIPASMVNSTVQTGAGEQLDIIEQRLMTRANMIDLANRFNVFENIREMEPDSVVDAMRSATSIRSRDGTRGGGRATMMIINFEARSPQIVANVVNEYVTLVLQENSRFRVSRAENTLEFFEQEVERLDAELSRRSVEIAQFRSENSKALPQDQAFRLGRQNLLQDRLEQLNREIRIVEQELERAEARFEAPDETVVAAPSEFEQQLLVRQAELDRLRQDYSENNPRIIRLKDRIESLKAIVSAGNSASLAAADSEEESSSQRQAQREAELEAARVKASNSISELRAQMATTAAELEEVTRNISDSASNAFQLAALEREYNIVQARYGSAVSNLNTARMGERIEATAQGQRINVIENASVPQIPSGPDRVLIAAVGISLGLGLAVGYFVLLEVLNRSIRRPAELLDRFDIKPIATVPYMESRSKKFVRRSAQITATLTVLVGVPLVLWYVDTYYLPLEEVVQRNLAKLGLG